jgi:hypothetical protein
MDAGPLQPPAWVQPGDAPYAGGNVLQDAFRVTLDKPREQVWPVVKALGAQGGMYHGQILWNLRGLLDKLASGVGASRGRRHPSELVVGKAVGFWRVLEMSEGRSLVLLAAMKAPGEAVLVIRLTDSGRGCELMIIGRFLPKGLAGRAEARIMSGPEEFTPSQEQMCLLPD